MQTKIVKEDIENIAKFLKEDCKKLNGKTVLITGAAGFMGSYFCDVIAYFNENFLEKNCKIIAVDNLISGNKSKISNLLKKPFFKFIEANVSKPFEIEEKLDFIIHAASIASPIIFRQNPLETMDSNTLGTKNLLELAKKNKVEAFLFTSTSEVYGDPSPENIPTKETYRGNVSCTGPRACYDESKRFGETLCMVYFTKFNVPIRISRSFNVYGPRLGLHDKRVLPDFMLNAWNNQNIVLLSDGSPTRGFCYITDSIRGHFKVLLSDANGEVFNIGNDLEEISILELAKCIVKTSGKNLEVEFKKSKDKYYLIDNPNRRCPNVTKLKEFFSDWKPEVMLKEGLERTWQYHLEVEV